MSLCVCVIPLPARLKYRKWKWQEAEWAVGFFGPISCLFVYLSVVYFAPWRRCCQNNHGCSAVGQTAEGVECPSLAVLKNRVDAALFHELWDDPASAGRLDQMTIVSLAACPCCGSVVVTAVWTLPLASADPVHAGGVALTLSLKNPKADKIASSPSRLRGFHHPVAAFHNSEVSA